MPATECSVASTTPFWLASVTMKSSCAIRPTFSTRLMIGFLVTAELLPLIVIMAGLAAVLGFAVAAVLRKSAKGLGSMEMPFGPYLCLAAWVTLLWGRDIWRLWIQFILSI